MKCTWIPLPLSSGGSRLFYLEIVLQDYHTAGPVAMDMEISVTGSVYIHGDASSAVAPHASNEEVWSFLGILLPSHRKPRTNLVWTCRSGSVTTQQSAALTYYSQMESGGVNHSTAPTGTGWLCVWAACFSFFLSSFSLVETHSESPCRMMLQRRAAHMRLSGSRGVVWPSHTLSGALSLQLANLWLGKYKKTQFIIPSHTFEYIFGSGPNHVHPK